MNEPMTERQAMTWARARASAICSHVEDGHFREATGMLRAPDVFPGSALLVAAIVLRDVESNDLCALVDEIQNSAMRDVHAHRKSFLRGRRMT